MSELKFKLMNCFVVVTGSLFALLYIFASNESMQVELMFYLIVFMALVDVILGVLVLILRFLNLKKESNRV